MPKAVYILSTFFIIAAVVSCSKKNHPTATTANKTNSTAAKAVKKPAIKTAVPKVITVNDKAAKRSVDGRYYYDLEGRRYWRNNRDGKYYLFNKSMFDDPDFKAPGN
jgi:hypothetical protein